MPAATWPSHRSLLSAVALSCAMPACASPQAPVAPKAEAPAPAAVVRPAEPVSEASLCGGRLVVEVDRVVIRRYPKDKGDLMTPQQPVLFGIIKGKTGPDELDVTMLAAPEVYMPGDPVRVLDGKRLLDRPVHRLGDRIFEVKLVENDSTLPPGWMSLSGAASVAVSQVVPGPAGDLISIGSFLIRHIDDDDIILRWFVDPLDLARGVRALPPGSKALRYRLLTPEPAGQAPAAELDLIAYLEIEAGCPNIATQEPRAP